MWMTGFDVPSCSAIYIDKPMSNHTLMQTIARANRVYEDKICGLIVDYVGILRNLEKALAIYAGASDEICLVLTTEPTSFMDAYATVKVLSMEKKINKIKRTTTM